MNGDELVIKCQDVGVCVDDMDEVGAPLQRGTLGYPAGSGEHAKCSWSTQEKLLLKQTNMGSTSGHHYQMNGKILRTTRSKLKVKQTTTVNGKGMFLHSTISRPQDCPVCLR